MTSEQYQWLKDNGYDPAVYDVDEQGNIFENPIAAPATRKKMSRLRAAGTSFLGNLLPSAAGLVAGAKAGALGGSLAGVPGTIIGGIGGGLVGGYGAGKLQEAALESFAPEAIAEMQRAQTDQPVASYLGGFAPNALAFRPSLQGMSGLLRPTVRGEETLRAALTNPNFVNPAANIAANVGASTAGQLLNISEGGEFSAPRFAADVALGTLFNRPTALGRAAGFQDLPQTRPVDRPDLAAARDQAEFMAYPPSEFSTPREERLGIGRELEGREQFFTPEGERMTEKAMAKDYTNWWKSETEPTIDLLKGAAEEVKAQIPRERLKELSQDPEVGEVLRDPSKMPAFIAKQADQTLEDVFQMMERRRSREFATAEEAANQKALQELRAERGVPTETPLSDVEAAYEAAKVNATDAAREVYTRLQRPEGAGENRITQQDIDFAAEVAARRGLKIELDRAFAGDQEVRGMYFVDKDGNRIIRVNPLMATPDTAIHEIGHDIFTGVTNKGMRRSLLDTALDSPAYKAELAAREAEVKAGRLTPEAARDIALEEGLIQAFGEQMPGINRGELRAWFKAFKASIKQLATGKLSPEDALAWMHYASTEAVPWKGVAVGKTGEERLQRREKPAELNALEAQLQQAQEAERVYKQQNPYDREGIKALEENSKKAMNAYFEKYNAWDEANPKYPGIENAPEFLPSKDKYYRSFQDPADDQTGLRHMAQGKIWPDAFVMEIESPRGVIDANNNALRGRFKPEQVTKIIHDVDSFEPYPYEYIAELQRKYPNAEIVDGVLNDREDGYRILGPAKSEPTADSSDIRYQRAPVDDASYLKAVESGDMKTAQQMVDEAAKAAGYDTTPRWHGTGMPSREFAGFTSRGGIPFTEFRPSKSGVLGPGIYTTTNIDDARLWAGTAQHEGRGNASVIGLYINPSDSQTSRSGREPFDPNAQWAVTGSPGSVKSSAPITYDDAGNVIPLSQRFQTESSDIRYQRGLGSDDAAYLKAVEAGDMETAQRMVDAAAKAAGLGESRLNNAGNPEVMYHGSGWSAHNVFERGKSPSGRSKPYPGYGLDDIGFWFTSSKNQATEYGSVLKQEGGKRPPERLYNVFLDIKNPLEFADQNGFNDWIDSYARIYAVDETSKSLMKGGRRLVGAVNVNMLLERLKMGKKDGIIIWKGNGDQRFGLKPDESYPTWAIVFDPSQIKSADPITRDDAGNVIPLSKRFQADSPDIRYQRAQQETPEFKNWFGESQVVDEQGKPLVVYHGTRSPEDFNTFRTDTGHNYGPGAYFTPEARRASGYAKENEGARVYSTYVKVEKPYIVQSDATVQDLGYRLRQDPANDALMQSLVSRYGDKNNVGNADVGNAWLRSQGYDGIIKQRNRYTENGYVPEVVEVVAFNPTQIKSATGNRGTFDPSNPDIRYQRSLLSKIQTPSELDYLVTKGGPFAEVGTTIKAAANTRDYKQGQWSSKYSLTNALPEEARVRLLNHLAGEFDSGVRSTPAADIRAAYDQLRNEYLPAIVNDYNSKGFMVRDTAGLRARGSNPTYFPLHAIADEVKNVLTTKQGSPEWDKLKADFINWNTQLKQADGASLAEAQRYANEKFDEKLSITAKPPGIESGIPFSGARKPEGYPLPPSWRSNDILDILNNYTRRSATDFAYQQHVESSPVAMAALGAKTMLNNQPIPANILQSTAPVINNPSVQSVLREYRGTPAQRTEGTLQSIGRFVGAATLGTVSKTGDIGTSMFKGLSYLPGSEYAEGLATFTNKIADWAALKERSYASGLNKRDAAENMRQVLGIAEDSTAFMDKAARVLSKVTFVNDLESVARVIAQGWGETVIGINKKLALGGDKNATQMLDTLTPDWRTRSDADLAAQVGRLLQGSYDMRQLPASVLEGAAAPYLTWSKWSMGQYDSFMKYALRPAMQGNMKPLMGQMVIGLLGGGAISAVQEWLNNREGKDITWRELESWMQQNQGELGADGGVLLGQKLLTMAQKMGTFGFAGDLVKMTLDAAAGGTSQGVATMPAVDAIYDVSKRTAAALKALDDGEDFGLVAKALVQDSLTGHVQVLRVARNWLDEDENLRYDDRRRQRLYDALSGLPSKGGAFSVSYSNLSEREFERGEIGEDTGEEALALVTRAREEAATPEDYASRIRKLKTSQNAIMPSLERQPMKAARYLSWLEGAEEGLGSETMRRYVIRQSEDKYRKSLIEGLSGLR